MLKLALLLLILSLGGIAASSCDLYVQDKEPDTVIVEDQNPDIVIEDQTPDAPPPPDVDIHIEEGK